MPDVPQFFSQDWLTEHCRPAGLPDISAGGKEENRDDIERVCLLELHK